MSVPESPVSLRPTSNAFAALRHDLEPVDPSLRVVDTLTTLTDMMELEPGDPQDWARS